MNNDTTFEKIEAWLSNELPEAEAQAFEAEIAANPALIKEVERHKHGREALDRLAEQAIQRDMTRWRESVGELPEPPSDAQPTAGTSTWRRWMPGGLLLILLGGAAYWFWSSENTRQTNPPQQETIPPQIKPDVPMVHTPPGKQDNENNTPKQAGQENALKLAESNLSNFHGALLKEYDHKMGDGDDEDSLFTAGVRAFKQNDFKTAKRDLKQVIKTNPFYPSAREILAFIYLGEKDYPNAVQCYEVYADQITSATVDWRLLQFYLADYKHHKEDFWKKLGEITDTDNDHQFQQAGYKLKGELEEMGVK